MMKAGEYREHARACRELAALMALPKNREQLLRMAESWDKLAEEREQSPGLAERSELDPS